MTRMARIFTDKTFLPKVQCAPGTVYPCSSV